MKTSTIIEYGAVDVTAKSDSTLNVNTTQSFSKLSELKKPNLFEKKYSTLEKNLFALDGKSENIGENVTNVGWWSSYMSDSNGDFETAPVMTITFEHVHSSIGLTLTFSKYAYCNSLKIQYYNANNILITEDMYTPDSYDYFCEKIVQNYKKIIITFYSTNVPYRYLKLYKILYGRAVLFEGDSLISANLLEQVNLLSDELTINTLDFVVYSNDDRFNILNPQGVYATLQQRQQLNVYQNANGAINNMGTFYIESWKSKNSNKMEFNGIDLVGLLDKTTFDGGIYFSATAGNILTEIFQSAGFDSYLYLIDSAIENILLTGYIPVCTHREALQQVLFTIGAIANCSRTDIIELYNVSQSQSPSSISRSSIFKGTDKIEQGDVITGVLLQAHNYSQSNEQKTLFEGQLPSGSHKIQFANPAYNVTCTGGTVVSSSANYANINVLTTGNVVIFGYEYIDNVQDIMVPNSSLTGNEKSNVLKIDSVYLINNSNAQSIGQRIIDYYNGKYTSKFKYVLDGKKVSDNIALTEGNNTLNGYITEMDIDLGKGYITNIEVVAKVVDS